MNADVDIKVGVQCRKRMWDEPFRPTNTYSANWHRDTDLDNYNSITGPLAQEIFSFIEDERAGMAQTTTHISIRVSNPTHPTPAAGVVPLAKGHFDITLSDGDIANSETIREAMEALIVNMRNTAKY